MTEQTSQPENNQSDGAAETAGPQAARPEYGVKLPDTPGAQVPSWHPEFNRSQPAAQQPAQTVTYRTPSTGEDVGRGALFAAAALPIGVVLWMVIWNFGWMSSFVTFAAAAMAARFYVLGSGGGLGRKGVWVVAGITAVTAVLSFVGGVWLDAAKYISSSPFSLISSPAPWDLINYNLANNPNVVSGYMGDFLMALLFGALGCFFTLRRLFAATRI